MPDVDPSLFTVIIPAYNAARWIVQAVTSAAQQQPSPIEIVVIDDGSTDDTAALARPLPLVRLVSQANRGEAAARNAGLRTARTHWVSFLDADDRFLPDRHRMIAEYLARNPDVAVVATDALLEVDGAIRGELYDQPFARFAVTDQRSAILDANFLLSHVVCDRERILSLGGFDETLSHACDWDMWIRLILSGGRIGLIETPLSVYQRHDSAMTSDPVRVTRGAIAVWTKALSLPGITGAERLRIDDHLAATRARLERDEMKLSIATGDGRARQLAVRIARSAAQPWQARVKAASVLVSPALHQRLLRRRLSVRTR